MSDYGMIAFKICSDIIQPTLVQKRRYPMSRGRSIVTTVCFVGTFASLAFLGNASGIWPVVGIVIFTIGIAISGWPIWKWMLGLGPRPE